MDFVKTVTIRHKHGLHARPAVEIVKMAAAHPGDVTMCVGEKIVNLKSVVGLMASGAKSGQAVTLRATGEGADKVIELISDFLERGGAE